MGCREKLPLELRNRLPLTPPLQNTLYGACATSKNPTLWIWLVINCLKMRGMEIGLGGDWMSNTLMPQEFSYPIFLQDLGFWKRKPKSPENSSKKRCTWEKTLVRFYAADTNFDRLRTEGSGPSRQYHVISEPVSSSSVAATAALHYFEQTIPHRPPSFTRIHSHSFFFFVRLKSQNRKRKGEERKNPLTLTATISSFPSLIAFFAFLLSPFDINP